MTVTFEVKILKEIEKDVFFWGNFNYTDIKSTNKNVRHLSNILKKIAKVGLSKKFKCTNPNTSDKNVLPVSDYIVVHILKEIEEVDFAKKIFNTLILRARIKMYDL